MAYSRSLRTLQRIYPLIQPLERGGSIAWAVERGQEHKFAYKVREALYIARRNRTVYPKLAHVSNMFEIRTRDGRVEAVASVPTRDLESIASIDPTGAVSIAAGTMEIKGMQTPDSVISTWLQHKPEKLHFPDAQMGSLQLKELYDWIQDKELLFFAHAGSLTIVQDDPDLRDLAWNPSDLED